MFLQVKFPGKLAMSC